MTKKKMLNKSQVKDILDKLLKLYPNAEVELDHSNNFELLLATILSAQCTDVRVNKVTKKLFKDYKTPEDYLNLTQEELGEKIRSCGFYRNKSKNILGTCQILLEKYNGEVPDTLEELMELPGVGRKTANVVLSAAFNKPAIAVDTHVFRVSNRLGLADSDDVFKTEEDLMENIDKDMWSKAHHLLIFHGRRMCKARNPICEECPMTDICKYYSKNVEKK